MNLLFTLLVFGQIVSANTPLFVEEIEKKIISDFNIAVDKDGPAKNNSRVVRSREEFKKNKPVMNKRLADKLEENRRILRERQKKYRESLKKSNDSTDWASSKQSEIDNWVNSKKQELELWHKEKNLFIKNIDDYKKDIVEIPIKEVNVPISKKDPPVEIQKVNDALSDKNKSLFEYYLVKDVEKLKVSNQGRRPTCASFAAAKALEIKLLQKKIEIDLSEQYLYYSSKNDCQSSPCSKKGSWPRDAFLNSMKSIRPDIPDEASCAYSSTSISGNETQVPLAKSCFNGKVKVVEFSEPMSKDEIFQSLKNNNPVIAGFRLDNDFYTNEGHVFFKNANISKNDNHAKGHALLIVGFMKLPKQLIHTQGAMCYLVLNSWGLGWGKGGYSCISEKWFDHFRFNIPFIAPSGVTI